MTERTGRCLCSAVRFTLSAEPIATRVCWCRDCQHLAANGTVNLLVPSDALTITGDCKDYTRTAASGNAVICQFCPQCGTHLFAKVAARPGFMIVRAGNLDEPSSVQPSMNIWAEHAPSWACLNSTLTRVEQQPLPPQPIATPIKPL